MINAEDDEVESNIFNATSCGRNFDIDAETALICSRHLPKMKIRINAIQESLDG